MRALATIRAVYPRVRGGTAGPTKTLVAVWGLSPRARGNHTEIVIPFIIMGSIPACAGEPRTAETHAAARKVYPRVRGGTAGTHRGYDRAPVYPRVRGGTAQVAAAPGAGEGLSPRARGNLRQIP